MREEREISLPFMGRVVAQRPGGEGAVRRSGADDLPNRPHPASPFGLSHPPHEGEGEGDVAFGIKEAAGGFLHRRLPYTSSIDRGAET